MNSNKRIFEICADENLNKKQKLELKDCGCTVETNCYCDAETEEEDNSELLNNEDNSSESEYSEDEDNSELNNEDKNPVEKQENYYNTYNFNNPYGCRHCGWFGDAQCTCENDYLSYSDDEDDNLK